MDLMDKILKNMLEYNNNFAQPLPICSNLHFDYKYPMNKLIDEWTDKKVNYRVSLLNNHYLQNFLNPRQ